VFDGDPYSAANINSIGRRATQADFHLVTNVPAANPARPRVLPNGQPYTLQYYVLNDGVNTRGGTFLFNGDTKQTYKGVSLTFNKRLSNRWMMRGNFTYSDWKWDIPSNAIADRTPFLGGGFKDGDIVMQGSGTGSGSFGGVYINSKWAYSINGLYQIAPDRPWGFDIAGNLNGRQGYPIPYYERLNPGVRGFPTFTRVQVTSASDSFRNDDIRLFDLRLAKDFKFSDFGVTLSADCFNVFNSGYVLQRQHRLRVAANIPANPIAIGSDFATEVVSPRIFRLGARFSFR